MTYNENTGRIVLPSSVTALVIPLVNSSLIPHQKNRDPYLVIEKEFEKHLDEISSFCDTIKPFFEIEGIPDDQVDDISPYWNNDYFSGSDPR